MGQITEAFIDLMLKTTGADGSGKHASLTVWEEAQLAHAWLQRERFRETLRVIAAQSSGIPGSTARADCMAALASATLRSGFDGEGDAGT